MLARLMLALLVVVSAASSADSAVFDDDRRGVVLGGGLGLSPVARWSAGGDGESMVGVGMHVFVGYAWAATDMIGFEDNSAIYSSDDFNSDSLIGSGDLLSRQGFRGASWYHYWGRAGSQVFTACGLGFCVFDRGEGYRSEAGGAYLLGIGSSFARHLQAGLYYAAGRTADGGRDFSHRHLSILVSYMGF